MTRRPARHGILLATYAGGAVMDALREKGEQGLELAQGDEGRST
jgi:hypothetical protein